MSRWTPFSLSAVWCRKWFVWQELRQIFAGWKFCKLLFGREFAFYISLTWYYTEYPKGKLFANIYTFSEGWLPCKICKNKVMQKFELTLYSRRHFRSIFVGCKAILCYGQGGKPTGCFFFSLRALLISLGSDFCSSATSCVCCCWWVLWALSHPYHWMSLNSAE